MLGKSALKNGITLWRLLADQPYFKLIEDQALEIKKVQRESRLDVFLMQVAKFIVDFVHFRLSKNPALLAKSYRRDPTINRYRKPSVRH